MDMLQNQVQAIAGGSGGEVVSPEASEEMLDIMSRGFEDPDQADGVAAEISRIVFDHHTRKH
jgi:hypothetical protein